MQRFVAAITTRSEAPAFARACAILANDLVGWRLPVDTALAKVWVQGSTGRSTFRRLGSAGCLIGADFQPAAAQFDRLLDDTWGAYVAFAVDEAARRMSVQRDPTGRIECWRMELEGVDLLFSHYADVHAFQQTRSPIDWAYLAHHLNQDYLHGSATAVASVSEVLPGERLVYVEGALHRRMIWRPHAVAEDAFGHLDEATSALRRAGESCVGAWADQYDSLTLDLSGGLDSAIVLGLLRRHARHDRVAAINWLMPGQEGDERPYAHAAAAMHAVELVVAPAESQDLDFSTPFPKRLLRPRARLLPMGYDELGAKLARQHRADAFFTGTGGDHLFYATLPRTAACDYLHHGGPFKGFVETAVALAQLTRDTVWGVSAAALRHYASPRAKAHEIGAWNNAFLSPAGRAGVDHDRFTHPTAVEAARVSPPAKLAQILNILELQRHYYRYGRAEAADETHPLFSQPMLEACLRTPAPWFGAGGMPRGLARRAFGDLLPPEILRRRSKGGNGVYWIRFMESRLARIRELLLDGRLASRGLLDRGRIERFLTPLGVAAARDFLALNICLTAELWVRQTEADWRDGEVRRSRLDQV